MSASIRVSGGEEVERAFDGLKESVAKKHAKTALREGAKVITREAKSTVPVASGTIKRNIRFFIPKTQRQDGVIIGILSVRKGRRSKNKGGDPWYWQFVESGHFMGKRPRGSFTIGGTRKWDRDKYRSVSLATGRKFVSGKHFMEHAYDSKADEAGRVATETLGELVTGEWKK